MIDMLLCTRESGFNRKAFFVLSRCIFNGEMLVRRNLFVSCLLIFVLTSSGFVVLFGADSSVWAQTYDGGVINSLIGTSDEGYAAAGETSFSWERGYDAFLTKFDASGNMEWNRTYGGPGNERARSVVAVSDGGYVIAGSTTSFGAGNTDFWLVKTDAAGNVEWNKTYGGGWNEYAHSLVVTPDDGFAIAGSTDSFGDIDSYDSDNFWLVKTDASGNEEWNQTYSRGIAERITSLVVTSDGGYALAGYSYHSGRRPLTPYHFWLVKTDEFGYAKWNQSYGQSQYDYAYTLVETSDGGYAIAGETSSLDDSGQDFWLIKTNKFGKMEWNQTYGRSGVYDGARLLVETSDGGYALAGDGFLVKTDADGNEEWNQTYAYDIGLLVEYPDSGYVIAGPIYSTTTYGIWSIRTDEFGVGIEFNFPDIVSPTVIIDSPTNQTYTTDYVTLAFTVDENISWMGYSLDWQDNVTITETATTLTGLTDGSHSLIVYAKDDSENVGTSETIFFTVNVTDSTPDTGPDSTPDAGPDSAPDTDSGTLSTWHMTVAAIGIAAIAIITILFYLTRIRKNKKPNN
jgi:hypothetical protein